MYKELIEQYNIKQKQLRKERNFLSLFRTITFILLLTCCFLYWENRDIYFLIIIIGAITLFLCLLWLNNKNSLKREITTTFIRINNEEIVFLSGEENPFYSGKIYTDNNHLYSSDLDIFGEKSLYQHLNRTRTYIGQRMFAEQMQTQLSVEEIKANQEAVKELSSKIKWRQNLQMQAILAKDSKEKYDALVNWTTIKDRNSPQVFNIVSFLLPSSLILSLLASVIFQEPFMLNVLALIFGINLLLFITQFQKIAKYSLTIDTICQTLKGYSGIFESIEKENFKSKKLRRLQKEIIRDKKSASSEIKKLSQLFSNAESLHNVIAAAVLNGLSLFHLHNFRILKSWKRKNASYIINWLKIIGEFETLNSLANFSYNNPQYAYPIVNKGKQISFSNLGHPLINEKFRVCNDTYLNDNELIILTGSNMSGKSTFLRAFGINMVLALMGSPICATKALLCPLKPIVSMRQNDSLATGESYFFAEIKRLKRIIEELGSEKSLVLLDEILKGTNSEDKRYGTEAFINKLIKMEAVGVIATHDLKICNIAEKYPERIKNKYFDVEINEDKLTFSYKLSDGVCQNKNATFLMKKMEVI